MRIKYLHTWNFSAKEAINLQKKLAANVKFTPLKKPPKLVAGLDCAFTKDNKRIIAAVVVIKLPDFELIEQKTTVRKLAFPYIPGLLSFREAPACIAAAAKLKNTPDLFLVDGQGIAHPRRLGLAAHLGLFLDKPTVGRAKSRLVGSYKPPPPQKAAYTLLEDKLRITCISAAVQQTTDQQVIGAVVRTRTNVKPVFVSVGNRCLLQDAINITLACTTKYRLPEPVRLAHQLVSRLRLQA